MHWFMSILYITQTNNTRKLFMAIWSKTSQNVYTGAEIFIFFVISGGNFRQYRTKIVRQMRRQIFRQMKQKAEWILDVFTSIFVKYDGKFASRWRAKSPDALCAVLPYMQWEKWHALPQALSTYRCMKKAAAYQKATAFQRNKT